MASSRLVHAVETGTLSLPSGSKVLLLEPPADANLDVFRDCTVTVQQNLKPAFDAFDAMGVSVTERAASPADLVHVTLPRSRDLARGLIAQAEALSPDGLIVVDGAKTDGIDSILKAVKARVSVDGQVAKAHGKVFWFRASNQFQDWTLPEPAVVAEGWITQPGIFSADGADPGSQALVDVLPKSLKGHGADLGGGWGFLTRHLLDLPGITKIDLVEADKRALACAERNIADDRVTLHWADATTWGNPGKLDWVVMNPPFHNSRTPDASIGQAFITSAARLLKPKGQLVMVANRHLPYETTLAASFVHVQELDGDSRFKILQADHPKPVKPAVRRRRH
ncbi:class I SAM-dependent methyltransferase [Marivita hallyeonensis]|uniref:16S rRNA (Guanine1207-N2)-methyltransferase n=1 Tax=Marivita hallyeonensis TaxID=996342 RepID=A0A1M5MEF4_9RHOB|nr:class I SAM-dependent methyltransferase [Marivita hallyeonensis]SHG75591.1 16S rRNA (guanine1207-N2)-methyltransferase [Marivita hallyeonensis]